VRIVTPIDPVYPDMPGSVWTGLLQSQLAGSGDETENKIAQFQWEYYKILMDWVNARLEMREEVNSISNRFETLQNKIFPILFPEDGTVLPELNTRLLSYLFNQCAAYIQKISNGDSVSMKWMDELHNPLNWNAVNSMTAATLHSSLLNEFDRCILLDANANGFDAVKKNQTAFCKKPCGYVDINPAYALIAGTYQQQLKGVKFSQASFQGSYKQELHPIFTARQKMNAAKKEVEDNVPLEKSKIVDLTPSSSHNIFISAWIAFYHAIQTMIDSIRHHSKKPDSPATGSSLFSGDAKSVKSSSHSKQSSAAKIKNRNIRIKQR
jgi:hypothetical protein